MQLCPNRIGGDVEHSYYSGQCFGWWTHLLTRPALVPFLTNHRTSLVFIGNDYTFTAKISHLYCYKSNLVLKYSGCTLVMQLLIELHIGQCGASPLHLHLPMTIKVKTKTKKVKGGRWHYDCTAFPNSLRRAVLV